MRASNLCRKDAWRAGSGCAGWMPSMCACRNSPPDACRYTVAPYRQLAGSPLNVWEFNTVPEFAQVMQHSPERYQNALATFAKYGRGCDLAVCVSEKLAGYVRERFGLRRTLVVPNGSDPHLFLAKTLPNTGASRPLQVVWIGSADLAWHNFDQMLAAVKILSQRGLQDRFTFHIIGKDFPHEGLAAENIRYHGPVPYQDLPGQLAGMDVGLVLYHPGVADYNSPLKFYDYLASELAVVSSEQPQVRQVLEGLDATDLLVPGEDAGALADVLQKLEGERARVRSLGQAGRQKVIDFYNWDRAAQDTFDEMKRLIGP